MNEQLTLTNYLIKQLIYYMWNLNEYSVGLNLSKNGAYKFTSIKLHQENSR